ncbi:hypothetical protein [Sinorhizobium medicae]
MNTQGMDKVRRKMRSATQSLNEAENANDYEQFVDRWTAFLLTLNAAFNALEKTIKGNKKHREWYEIISKERYNDPLMRYLIEARNVEEHGLAPVTGITPYTFAASALGGGGFEVDIDIGHGNDYASVKPMPGSTVVVQRTWPRPILVKIVKDNRGVTEEFAPPTSHLGNEIASTKPIDIGVLGLGYLQMVVDAAERELK